MTSLNRSKTTPGKKNLNWTNGIMKKVNQQPDKKTLREFGLITGAIFAGLFGLLFPWLFERSIPLWPWILLSILWVWALILPASLLPVYRGWMAIGHVLGWINTRIILGIMFYIIFLPIGIIMKLFGKDPMARTIEKSQNSYRITNTIPKKEHVERPY